MLWRIAQRDCAVAVMRPAFGANWRTAADVKSVHDHLSRHHAARKSNEHVSISALGIGLRIGFGTSPYAPGHARRVNGQSPPWAWILPPPPSHHSRTGCTDHFHGRARSCLTG